MYTVSRVVHRLLNPLQICMNPTAKMSSHHAPRCWWCHILCWRHVPPGRVSLHFGVHIKLGRQRPTPNCGRMCQVAIDLWSFEMLGIQRLEIQITSKRLILQVAWFLSWPQRRFHATYGKPFWRTLHIIFSSAWLLALPCVHGKACNCREAEMSLKLVGYLVDFP